MDKHDFHKVDNSDIENQEQIAQNWQYKYHKSVLNPMVNTGVSEVSCFDYQTHNSSKDMHESAGLKLWTVTFKHTVIKCVFL